MRVLNKQVPPRHPHPRSQQGITLIELMIALVIGLLATGAMLKVYVDSSRLYRFNESLARIQENGRFGLEFIRRDARMAGFWGCNSAVVLGNVLPELAALSPHRLPYYVTGTNDGGDNDSDTITFTQAASGSMVTAVDMASASSVVSVVSADSLGAFADGDVLIITDCVTADIFEFKSTGTELSKAYATGSRLYRVQQTTFCIEEDADTAQPMLRRLLKPNTNLAPNPNAPQCPADGDELVEGIENMQILMGEDTNAAFDGSVNRYVYPGHAVAENLNDYVDDRIVSVRISLLAVSPYNNVTTERAPYFFNGAMVRTEDISTDDRYLRKDFTTTVALRNKNWMRTEDVSVEPVGHLSWEQLFPSQ